MNSIDFETLIVIIFVLVDDWYQKEGKVLKGKSPGAKAEMSDSEIISLAIMMDYLPFPGETQFIGFIRAKARRVVSQSVRPKPVQQKVTKTSTNAGELKKKMG